MSRSQVSKFAKLDPAHVLDGLFVPVYKKGLALYDVKGHIDGLDIAFEGVQMTAAHQSVLLAVAALTGRQAKAEGLLVSGTADDLLSRQLSLLSPAGRACDKDFSLVKTSAYALLSNAGINLGKDGYQSLKDLLHQMSTVVMYRGRKGEGGTSQLLSFQHREDQFVVSLNWRMTEAIFGGQNIHVSLTERMQLSESPIAKILHTWLSAYVRPNGQLMAGGGAELNTLIRHVWGNRPCSAGVMKQRRIRIRDALEAIERLQGWTTRIEGTHAFVSRPKLLERSNVPTPGEILEIEALTERAWSESWKK